METFVRPFTSMKPIMNHKLWFRLERLLAFSTTKRSLSRVNPLMYDKLRLPLVRLLTTTTLVRPFATVSYLVKKQFWFVQKRLFTIGTLVVVDFTRALLIILMTCDRGRISIKQLMALTEVGEITCRRLGEFVHRWNTLGFYAWNKTQRLILKSFYTVTHFLVLQDNKVEENLNLIVNLDQRLSPFQTLGKTGERLWDRGGINVHWGTLSYIFVITYHQGKRIMVRKAGGSDPPVLVALASTLGGVRWSTNQCLGLQIKWPWFEPRPG